MSPAPRPPRPPRLRLSPVRTADSTRLDGRTERISRNREVTIPPFVRWDAFYEWFAQTWGGPKHQGEHVTFVGTTGSGKTTLARQLLPIRQYVIVLATKKRDDSLYKPLERAGYHTIRSVDQLNPAEHPRVIYRPPLDTPDKAGMQAQAEAFRDLLVTVFDTGNWALYCDEIRYLSDNLGLKTELEALWLQGRSLGISLMASTQRPVAVPLLAFSEATHLFLWRNNDAENVKRMSEFAGSQADVVRATIPQLPMHEALYINTRTDEMVRTRVIL